MKVKLGFKQTEIGSIPKEWEVKLLGDLSQTSSGTTPSRALQDRYYKNGTIGWVKTLDLRNTGLLATSEYVTELALKETCLRIYPIGTVLVAMYGGFQQIGRTALLRIPAAVNQAITAIQPKGEKLNSEYLLATLNHRVGFWRTVASSSRKDPNITGQDIRTFPIACPKIHEQRAIATTLGDVDELLSALDQLMAKKRDLKQATMQQLLTGKTRLPGFQGKWEKKRLGDCLISRPDYGINAAAIPFSDRFPSYIRITDISENGCFCPAPRVSVKAAATDRYYLHKGDIVFARTGASVGKSYLYNPRDGKLVFAGFLIRVRPNPDLLVTAFLGAYVTTKPYWNWVRLMSMRSGQPGINGAEYAQLPILVPPLAEQNAIASLLMAMDDEVALLKQRREKIRVLKQAMMQELLTGRTRLLQQ